jgi:hypothetical protein
MDDTALVRALLERAGFTPPDDDVAALAASYPMVRGMADLLYTVDAARYESPAQRFEPEPRVADWA